MSNLYKVPVRGRVNITVYYDSHIEVEADSAKEALELAKKLDKEELQDALAQEQDDFKFDFSPEDIYAMEKEAYSNTECSINLKIADNVDEESVEEIG